jgi:glycosyltransferase involved in cell wall biosynthesis
VKVLYLGCFRDGTGWGHAALDYILALDAAGVDVVPRPIKLNAASPKIPDRVVELESKPSNGPYDAVIQHILPTFYDYNGNIPKNIGMYATETDTVIPSWVKQINLLDRAWVFNAESKNVSAKDGVTVPISVVPHACDVTRYQKKYNPLPLRDKIKDDFVFYFIGEYNKRKNLTALLQAFHLEFEPSEPVQLAIKTSCPIHITHDVDLFKFNEEVVNYCRKVKDFMRLYPSSDSYKQEILITSSLSEDEMMRLHASCDCFVCPSHGEAWCIPAFDAMALGKTPIVTNTGGFREYITHETGYPVACDDAPVFAMGETSIPGMFTSRENWMQPYIMDLRVSMREAFENRDAGRRKAVAGIKKAYEFSHAAVGRMMVEALND